MKLLLIALVCALAGCSLDTVDDTPILLRHRGGDRVDADAGAGQSSVAGAAGAQAGSLAIGGAGQGGASGSTSAGSDGASAGSAGLVSTAGAAGASGSAGLAGSAGDPAGGAPGGQGGAAGSQEAGAAGAAGSSIDYFQGCAAPLWIPLSGLFPSAEYLASIPLNGQVQALCGAFFGQQQNDRCIWTCRDPALCGTTPPDGSESQSAASVAAWGYRPFCDCFDPNNNCANAPH